MDLECIILNNKQTQNKSKSRMIQLKSGDRVLAYIENHNGARWLKAYLTEAPYYQTDKWGIRRLRGTVRDFQGNLWYAIAVTPSKQWL